MGRVKKEKWGERNIDIDILSFGNESRDKPELTIPHPYLTERSFVLAPLFELDPELSLPNIGKIDQYIDSGKIKKEIISVF